MDLDKALDRTAPRWQMQPCNPREMKQVMTRWQRELEGRSWNGASVANHDQKRAISRFDGDWFSPE
jgi:oligo-1,6-glucosidase